MLDYFWVSARSGAHPENNTVVSEIQWSYHPITLWLDMFYYLCHSWDLSSFFHFLLDSVAAYHSPIVSPPVLPNEFMLCYVIYLFIFSATPLLRLSLADVNHKMVDQRLFPARPLPVWVGLAADFIPGFFFFIRCKIRALPFSFFLGGGGFVPSHTPGRVKAARPSVSSTPGHRGLDAAGRNSCSNKNQSPASVDEFVHAANLAACDNVIIADG